MTNLPDFLRLTDEQRANEEKRQDRLRREFNSRARLSSAEMEFARAMILETDHRRAWEESDGDDKASAGSRLAETVASMGRFLEAAALTGDETARSFYEKASAATQAKLGCKCEAPLASVAGKTIRLPKYRVLKQIYSMPAATFGYLAECNVCGSPFFMTNDPTPKPIDANEFIAGTAPNDIDRLATHG